MGKETFATEEAIQEMEKDKMKQDLLIDSITQQIHLLETQIQACKQQYELQEKETAFAKETIIEANAEMEQIRVQKREITQGWKFTVLEIQRREEALRKSIQFAEREKELITNLNYEIEGTRDEVISLEEENNHLQFKDEAFTKQIHIYNGKIEDIKEEQKKDEKKIEALREKIIDKDRKITDNKLQKKNCEKSIHLLDKEFQKTVQERHKIEMLVDEEISNELTLKHGSEFQLKEYQELREKIREKEISQSKITNSIAKLRFLPQIKMKMVKF